MNRRRFKRNGKEKNRRLTPYYAGLRNRLMRESRVILRRDYGLYSHVKNIREIEGVIYPDTWYIGEVRDRYDLLFHWLFVGVMHLTILGTVILLRCSWQNARKKVYDELYIERIIMTLIF